MVSIKSNFQLLLAVFFLGGSIAIAQKNSAQLLQQMRKLEVTGSVLYIAAHPDDENTRLLTWLANEKKVRTGYLSLTRGDGGQNLIGKEQGEALGLLRTQELLAARRTDGAEQFFTRANDFGFSKNPEETFTFWNKDSILYDVVLAIRKFRPDVIVCRFPTTGEGGHGHHTASAILALEAFDAAADPQRFPDQLSHTPAWQCRRIFWNTFNFGGTNTTSENQLRISCGNYNPLLGKSYGEIAAESRSMHKSQGFGSPRQRGQVTEYFKLLKGDSAKSDLLEDINITWTRCNGGGEVTEKIRNCINTFDALHPEKSMSALKDVYLTISKLDESDPAAAYWKKIKLQETLQLICECSGLFAEALLPQNSVVAGEVVTYSLQVINRSDAVIKLKSVTFINGRDSITDKLLKRDEMMTFKTSAQVPLTMQDSEPYWLSRPHGPGHYWYPGPTLAGRPENPAVFSARFVLEFENITVEVVRPLVFKSTDPVKGEQYRNVEVLPALDVQPSSKLLLFTSGQKKVYSFGIRSNVPAQKGIVRFSAPSGWKISISDSVFQLARKGDEKIMSFTLQATEKAGTGKLNYSVISDDGNIYDRKMTRIEYDHIPPQFFLEEASSKLVMVPVSKHPGSIGYIAGAGDEVMECLQQAGYEVTLLKDEMLRENVLSKYSAVVTGVRAFNTNDKLYTHLGQLMQYVKQGGNLIIQYNTNSRIGPLQSGIGPYPFTISRDRVTDENAPVQFKLPDHPALNHPNKITARDFEGWVQERGIYFASELDPHYQAVLQMNDKNEKAQDGSLIIAPYGKGNFVYTGLAFFRELPAGVPGAYRLFVNLLNLPGNKK